MGAMAILALIEGGARAAEQIALLIQRLKAQATVEGVPAADVDAAIARGKAAAAKLDATAQGILDRIGGAA